MKIKIFFLILFSVVTIQSQSILTIGSGATLDVSGSADICSDSLSGIVTGAGTFCGNPTDAATDINGIAPTQYALNQNYPNPFNPSTTISYQLPISGQVILKVFDVLGNEVATLVNEEKPAGNFEIEFSLKSGTGSSGNAYSLSSGIYFYKLQAGSFVAAKKMQLLK
jgi:hypothetical protein